ncbi:MAG TPA: flagellar biosynthesis protein FlhB [Mesorhizobium sp.]|jgi:flagellar biosynthetic protein FlhB|nr:flagellar biosynthesis protein FlhB [Mesorhizobium sp.]
MADEQDPESKTEEPTEKKIRDAVEEGRLPHSREAPILASFAAILVFTMFFAADAVRDYGRFLGAFLEQPEAWPLESKRDLDSLFFTVALESGRVFGVLFLLLIAAGVLASVLQHSPTMVLSRIQPKWSRLSLAGGWKRLFGSQGLVEFAKSVAKLSLGIGVVAFALRSADAELLTGLVSPPDSFGFAVQRIAVRALFALTLVMTAIGVADFAWSRFSWRRELRMTKQEVKDEMKQAEGDPIVKSRIRSVQRDRARRRMIAAVPRATLVIANPTHYSIALRYVREENDAPVVLAKGQDLLALKIREIAAENDIPVFEDVALARSMYNQVSVDSVIPPQFYQAVAELVRIVFARNGQGGRSQGGAR